MKRTTVEIWKPVVGYEDRYEVSSWGRVRSVDREYTDSLGRLYRYRGKVLRLTCDRRGYQQVTLTGGDGVQTRFVHRLVAEAFIRPRREGEVIMHSDDDPSNNRLENLSVGTQSENMLHCVERGRYRNGQSEKTHCRAGHEFDSENTYLHPNGSRKCRACARKSTAAYAKRKRESLSAPSCASDSTVQ